MSNDILVNIQRDAFEYLSNLIDKEFNSVSKNSSFTLHDRKAFIDEDYYRKSVSDFVEKLHQHSRDMVCLEYLKEVFNLPMVNMRLTDEEIEILDYGVDESGFSSRKVFLMSLVKDHVIDSVLKLPVNNLSDDELLVFIERNKIQKYEDIKSFTTDEQFKRIIEESVMFEDLSDYENQRNKLLGTGADTNE